MRSRPSSGLVHATAWKDRYLHGLSGFDGGVRGSPDWMASVAPEPLGSIVRSHGLDPAFAFAVTPGLRYPLTVS